jgi:mannosyltransferase OCH1-like enzyme
MPIPKIIHQTWKDKLVPVQWHSYQNKIKSLHPDWQYRLWTDADNDLFVQKEFPAFYPVYQSFPKNIMRADVIRYMIMYRIGGLYLDLDYEMLKPFQYAQETLVLPVSRDISFGDRRDLLGNCIFASVPNHIFWKDMIDDLQHNPPTVDNYLEVLHTTGPEFLSRIFYAGNYEDAYLPNRLVFHPPTPRSNSQYQKIIQNGISEGIHHADGTWREKTIMTRVKTGVKLLLNMPFS